MHVPLKYFFETLVNTSYPSFCYKGFLDNDTLGVLKLILFTQQFLHYLDFLMSQKKQKCRWKTQFTQKCIYTKICKNFEDIDVFCFFLHPSYLNLGGFTINFQKILGTMKEVGLNILNIVSQCFYNT